MMVIFLPEIRVSSDCGSLGDYEICKFIQAFAIRRRDFYFAWKRASRSYVKKKNCRCEKDYSIQLCLF